MLLCVSVRMSGAQCGLCLSCGAPFPPKSDEIVLFNHTGNMSILYIHTQFVENTVLNRVYEKPVFTGVEQKSHIIHGSHHEGALTYMCFHHKGDMAPKKPAPLNSVITGDSCMFPYLKSPTTGQGPQVATWTRPTADKRMNFDPLLQRLLNPTDHIPRDAGGITMSLKLMYPICTPCNSLMTVLSKMRYLLGFTNTANNNPFPCIISIRESPISTQEAVTHKAKVDNAYGNWTLKTGAAVHRLPSREPENKDTVAPHVAYYLHLCLPHSGVDAALDTFNVPTLPGSELTARCTYLELSWLILEIACLASLLMDGKSYNAQLSHGQHQHYGVLDLYVSYFLWRLLQFEYPTQIRASGLDFPQWHQKYYCVVLGCPKLGLDKSSPILGIQAFGNLQTSTKEIVEEICARLINLYTGPLQPLVMFVTNTWPHPPLVITEGQTSARQYFLPLRTMKKLLTLSIAKVRANIARSGICIND